MTKKKSAAILLFDKKKNILLQKRSNNAIYKPEKWGLFGGGIEVNESKLDAVVRECFEELRYKLISPTLVYEGQIRENIFMCLYCEEYNQNQDLVLCEGEKMQWFSISQIAELDMIEHYKELILHHWNLKY